jgi:tetratricopeptide (TPR) repeat protein
MALNDESRALPALHQALFIAPENVSAIIHLCKIYLSPSKSTTELGSSEFDPDRVDLVAGMLQDLTHGDGWDVPETWYFLAKAYKMQGRYDRERECLSTALVLSETTRVRQIVDAVGWCL